jgi:GNAT superfamily N-acetyltransferase
VREPLLAAEVGRLYRLFRDADYPQQISEQDLQLVVMDGAGKVVGGLTFTMQDKEVAYLGAFVVAASLKGRGIATALLEDFCVRMAARRVRLLKTDFFLRPYLTANGFHVDARCGGLVRHLTTH